MCDGGRGGVFSRPWAPTRQTLRTPFIILELLIVFTYFSHPETFYKSY